MVTIAVSSESADEPRVAVSPDTVKKFTGLGAKVRVESGAGLRSRFSDDAYRAAGAEIASRADALAGADILLKVRRPSVEDVAALKPGAIVAGMIEWVAQRILAKW
jgi:NAD(P) transhydrogenase subunit alpha